ncbi:PTPRS [Mytilus edulis]|uniref:PTPRS n=1 Tax=Mytilus edulis TaxID=6550 RepID=A0A8S3TBP6_MYTED|nr:PTPRS [Mytilus edulis]
MRGTASAQVNVDAQDECKIRDPYFWPPGVFMKDWFPWALFESGCPFALNITSTQIELKWDEPSVGADCIDFYQIRKNTSVAVFEPGCPSALDITSTKVELKWDEPSVGSDFIHCYQIICKEQSNSRRCLFETPRNDCNYVVDGLKPNTEYAFKIQAIKDGKIRGPYSGTLTVSTLKYLVIEWPSLYMFCFTLQC